MATDGQKQKLVPLYMGKRGGEGENRKTALQGLCAALGYIRKRDGAERGSPSQMIRAMIDAWLADSLPQWFREQAEKLSAG